MEAVTVDFDPDAGRQALRTLQTDYFQCPIEPTVVAAKWRAEGYSCHTMTDRAGQEWNDFTHATNEVVTVVDGRLRLILAGEAVEAAPGDLVFIPRHVAHSVHIISDGPTTWMFGYD
jgi:quercetin dioxygenase-like cupin family protein